MAQVLEEMYPGIKLTLGPAVSNGFYYDVDFENHKITDVIRDPGMYNKY